ncbi:MAG: T9SS type A sorting domain-containing protein, partial [candidate division Zixibacteria bacterium]|nr:T9SS type A sorting domain-containing protein [candidate division Zixibacteria bacterium]
THPDSTGWATATDNCDASPTITYSDGQTGNVLTRTWTAADDCSNSSQCVQTILVGDGTPPVCNVPDNQTIFQCEPAQDSLPVSATHNAVCEVISGPGEIIGDNRVYTPTGEETVSVTVRCSDACSLFCEDNFVITFDMNAAPTISMPATGTTVFYGSVTHEVCVPFTYGDEDDNITDIWVDGPLPLTLTYSNGSGEFCFTPPAVEDTLVFTVYVQDACPNKAVAQATHIRIIHVLPLPDPTTCIVLEIEDTDCLNLGTYAHVDIMVDAVTEEMAGFDLLITYDATAFQFTTAEIGAAIDTWEYFTYRPGPFGNCGGPCPSGLLRLVSIADVNNGPNHPDPAQLQPHGVLVTMVFRITTDQTLAGYTFNVDFFWIDCGDNGVSSVTGDTLFIDKLILNTDHSVLWDEYDEVNYPETQRLPHVGAPDECLIGDKIKPRRCIVFVNGTICIIHPDSIDAVGDINLNGISHEIADAVLFTNYLLYGLSVFTVAPYAQLAATDINRDGMQATVGDLVYLIRIITGDALPLPKLAPFAQSATVTFDGNVVRTESDSRLGALLLTFNVDDDYLLTNLTEMTLIDHAANGKLKVLVYDISTNSIPAGMAEILRIEGNAELVSVQIADYYGNQMTNKLEDITIPDKHSLNQNYPNPFNPQTVIEFALPLPSVVTLEVYNIAGQKVATLTDDMMAAGYHRFSFNGIDDSGNQLASGIYLYRLVTDNFSETKKMLLIK